MAQTSSQLVTRYRSTDFQDQCLWAVLFLVRWITNESENTVNHANRVLWTKAAMANPAQMAQSMSAFAISDAACIGDTAPTDEQVKSAMEALVNRYTE